MINNWYARQKTSAPRCASLSGLILKAWIASSRNGPERSEAFEPAASGSGDKTRHFLAHFLSFHLKSRFPRAALLFFDLPRERLD